MLDSNHSMLDTREDSFSASGRCDINRICGSSDTASDAFLAVPEIDGIERSPSHYSRRLIDICSASALL